MLSNLFYFVLTLSVLVTFHEYGHFWVARKCGVRVLRFSVGFGRPLFRWLGRDGTEYVIAAIPLGGYVKMLDSREMGEADSATEGNVTQGNVTTGNKPNPNSRAFNHQPASARTAIIAAGPLANFLLAVLVYALVYMLGVPGYKPLVGEVAEGAAAERAGLRANQMIVEVDGRAVQSRADVSERLLDRLGDTGEIQFKVRESDSTTDVTVVLPIERWLGDSETPDPYGDLGFSYWYPEIEPVVGRVLEGDPAHAAGMRAGDRLIFIDGVAIQSWQDATDVIRAVPGQRVLFEVDRADTAGNIERQRLWVKVAEQEQGGEREGRIGVAVQMPQMPDDLIVVQRFGPVAATIEGIKKTGDVMVLTLDSVKKMLVGLISPTHLGGPVTIAKIAGMSAESGLVAYLQMLALLSVSLGIFNLFPIPVLDGGHLLIIAVETLVGRPIPEKLLMSVQQVGLILLLSIMAFAIYNDIARL